MIFFLSPIQILGSTKQLLLYNNHIMIKILASGGRNCFFFFNSLKISLTRYVLGKTQGNAFIMFSNHLLWGP